MTVQAKHDINSEEDVRLMVDTFYDKVNADKLLSPVFNDVAQVDWPHHLPKMYQFWNFLLLGISGYKGQPFPMHSKLPITHEHFNKWLELFNANIDENFSGVNSEMAKAKAQGIALTFQYKMGILE
jgi:hemoglobin